METIWWRGEPPATTTGIAAGRHDVVVVGAGVTGLTTAWLLARAGMGVVVVEARHPGAGTTGRTTGKVSALQGTLLSRALAAGREDHAEAYVASTLRAMSWLEEHADDLGVPLERRDALTYAPTSAERPAVAAEHRAARQLGLPVAWLGSPDLPVPAVGAVALPDQLQLDPGRLVDGLTRAATAAGATVVTGWRLRRVRQRADQVVLSLHREGPGIHAQGEPELRLRAGRAVLATGAAVVDRRLHFARLEAERSYLLAAETASPPSPMAFGAGASIRSFRSAEVDGRRVLLVGGAGHPTGRGRSESERLAELREWTVEHWPDATELAAWSAQDYATTDHLPLVGSLGGPSPDVHLATGFNKWGLTSGVAAALALSGNILGTPEPWAERLYERSWRLRDAAALASIQAGVAIGGTAAAVQLPMSTPTSARRAMSAECRLIPVCTHLGGVLRWNDQEQSYDCPLHGSRFDPDGRVLEGPATRPLRRLPGVEQRKTNDVTTPESPADRKEK